MLYQVLKLEDYYKEQKYIIWVFLFGIINMFLIAFVFGFVHYTDSRSYIETIHFFSGTTDTVHLHRLLHPLGPLLALPFEYIDPGAGLIVQNIIFYFLSIFLVFKIVVEIFSNKRQAFFSVILFASAIPVLKVGLAYLTDTGAWFFYFCSVLLSLYYIKKRDFIFLGLSALLSGVGVLMKENGGLGLLFFTSLILLIHDIGWKDKFKKIFLFSLFFLFPIIIFQVYVYLAFEYTYLDWYLYNSEAFLFNYGIGWLALSHTYGMLKTLNYTGWLLFLVGLAVFFYEKSKGLIKKETTVILLALLPSSFSFLLWPASEIRLTFIFVLLGVLLASKGMIFLESLLYGKGGKVLVFLFLIIIIFLNYTFATKTTLMFAR